MINTRALLAGVAVLACTAGPAHAATTYDARISAIEVLQITQYPEIQVRQSGSLVKYSGVALRQGVRTFVRVYVNTGPNGPTVPGLTVDLRGYELTSTTQAELSGGPLRPYTADSSVGAGNGDTHVPTDAERDDANGAFLFEIPIEWTLPGNGPATRFQAILVQPAANSSFTPCTSATCAANNVLGVDGMVFRQMCCVDVAVAKIEVTENGQRVGPTHSPATVLADAYAMTPVGIRGPSTYQATFDGDKAITSRVNGIAQMDTTKFQSEMETFRVKQGADIAIAIGPPNTNLASGGYWWAYVRQGLSRPGIVHEFQHALGRLHAGRVAKGSAVPMGCGQFDQFHEYWSPNQLGMIDGSGIFPDGRYITGFFSGQVRYSAYPVYMSRTQAPESDTRSANTYDFQSYCRPAADAAWMSPRAWDTLVDVWRTGRFACSREQDFDAAAQLGTWADRFCNSLPVGTIGAPRAMIASASGAQRATAAQAPPAPGLSVEGAIAPDGTVSVREVRPRPAVPGPAESPYTLVARDAGGAEIARVAMAVAPQHAHNGAVHPTRLLATAPVAAAQAAAVEIEADGRVVASRRRSANPPQVAFLSPVKGQVVGRDPRVDIRWTATDADGDPLDARVEWSADGGKTWRSVAAGQSGARVRLPSDYFAGTRQGVLRLHVSDGFNETVVLSERFVTVHRPPSVQIVTPPDGVRIRRGTLVNLLAEALDERGRPLADRRVRWFDGRRRLGRGTKISTDGLRRGRHVLRVVARDGAGRTASARVRVRVR